MRPFDPRLVRELPQTRAPVAALGLLGAAAGVAAIGQAFAIAWLVTALVGGGSLWAPAVTVATILAVRGILSATTEVTATWAGARVAGVLRERILGRWSRATADDRPAPERMLTISTHGASSVEPYVARYLPALVAAAVVPPLAIVTLLVVDWSSALIVVATVPLLPVFAALIGRHTQEATQRRWATQTRLAGHFLDVMRGLPTLVSYGRAEKQADQVAAVGDRHRIATVRTLKIAFLSSAALELLATISVAIVAVWTGMRLAWGNLDLQVALTAILLAPEAYWPIRRVGQEFHAAADGAEAIDALLADVPPACFAGRESMSVRDLSYRYPGANVDVLQGISYAVRPGLTVVTGPSGCGKTTLLELLAGLRTPTAGAAEVPRTHLVTQTPFVLPATVADNLALGTGASPAQIAAACAATGLDRVIAGLPDGTATLLGDNGFGLSAGQRARLGLTRAMLSDAAVVLLDEPTAHLDPASARQVRSVIRDLARTRPVVAVTHDPELAALADAQWPLTERVPA
ncbi:thiol reductant ABC exporter subunit CydD [Calidifontibacter sp. DB0510]|uniref:Thiol reductant ABC exporter subunit CydD n=1 Tax=Metallococcus carri TaxID=1656884 RepID=A0A967EHV8_9MICO|nr:thiol reductant ABC exporter subunit CydD [Metallococcus carri]NHN57213.1 thiol reductant ABC exporter subunit CydD [Metallococcus carri]NOP37984.1 thiol reductant ABC exporter subunit CydD [Calidifontibacter sp. DB2511S]